MDLYNPGRVAWALDSYRGEHVTSQKLTGEVQIRVDLKIIHIWNNYDGAQRRYSSGGNKGIGNNKRYKDGCHKYRGYGVVNWSYPTVQRGVKTAFESKTDTSDPFTHGC
jgi:hypothetical protein